MYPLTFASALTHKCIFPSISLMSPFNLFCWLLSTSVSQISLYPPPLFFLTLYVVSLGDSHLLTSMTSRIANNSKILFEASKAPYLLSLFLGLPVTITSRFTCSKMSTRNLGCRHRLLSPSPIKSN